MTEAPGWHSITEAPGWHSRLAARLRRNGAIKLFAGGSSLSMLGSRATAIAYPMLVLHATGSPATAGWVAFIITVPSLLIYMPVGALVDRWNPERALRVSETSRGIAIGTVAAMLVSGHCYVILLIVAGIVEEAFEVVWTFAEQRYVRDLVARTQVPTALAGIEGRTHVANLAGRPLGAFLFEINPFCPFLFNTVSFFLSAGALVRIRNMDGIGICLARPPATPAGRERAERNDDIWTAGKPPWRRFQYLKDIYRDIRAVLRWLRGDSRARLIILLSAGATLISQALIMIFLVDSHKRGLSAAMTGMLLAASGVGGILGSIGAKWSKKAKKPLIQIQLQIWVVTFFVLIFFERKSLLWMAAAMAVMGFAGALGNIQFSTYLNDAAGNMLARVISISSLMSFAACAAGSAVGGMLVQLLKTEVSIIVLFFVTGALAFVSIRVPAMPPPQGRDQSAQHAQAGRWPTQAADPQQWLPARHTRSARPGRQNG
ncbi:MAG TPA: MFS transporter [Streptosporangiaceae bacterium]|nr:MFS transporter [Streptosporangiaceae bacterium]